MVDFNKPAPRKPKRFSEEIIRDCLRILKSGDVDELFEIIPRIGVIREPRFRDYLVALLQNEDPKRREFAAYAMGAMGSLEFLEPLQQAFAEVQRMKGPAWEKLQVAIIEAIGAIGDDAAVDIFQPMLQASSRSDMGAGRLCRRIVESLGAIAQQGGQRSLQVLLQLTEHFDPDIRAHSLSEISVAFWHRPNDIPESMLQRIHELARDSSRVVSESALSALQSLADVGCRRAERLFSDKGRK